MTPALEFKNVALEIGGKTILDRVTFTLPAGKITGLIGRSGSGKSMTALAAIGLAPADATVSGEILLNGENILDLPESKICDIRGRLIAMVFQEPMTALNPLQTIGAQIAECFTVHKSMARRAANDAAATLLQRVGLEPALISPERYPHELTGGQRQRVVIAMAIALKPAVLIADEPTTALDVTTQAEILTLLKQLAEEDDIALLLITHDLAVISQMAENIAVMSDGRIVDQGPAQAFFEQRLSDAASELIAPSVRRPENNKRTNEKPVLTSNNVLCEYVHAKSFMFSPATKLRAVDQVSFILDNSEIVGLVGESGCGKSTLAKALLGLHPLAGGNILIDGEAFPAETRDAMRRCRRHIQIVFQDPYSSFNPRHRVGDILSEPFHLLETQPDAATKRKKIAELLSAVGLAPSDAEKFPHQFSGGQRQRVAIARALITDPSIIILDEATSALDITSRNRILELLVKLSEERAVSYLFITHDLSLAREITDRILVMKDGRIVEQGETGALFNNPQHAYTKRLLAATPKIKWPAHASG